VLMGLTALRPQSEPKTTPRSSEWCESGQQGPWQTVVPFHKLVCSIICAASGNRNQKRQTHRDSDGTTYSTELGSRKFWEGCQNHRTAGIPPLDASTNGHLPLRPDRDLLLWRDSISFPRCCAWFARDTSWLRALSSCSGHRFSHRLPSGPWEHTLELPPCSRPISIAKSSPARSAPI
jgi:hypothetical protein